MSEVSTWAVLTDIAKERKAQDERWGEQNHRYIAAEATAWVQARYEEEADSFKETNDALAEIGQLGWDGILLEEVYEALAETDPAKQREEMVQVAAVAACIIEAIDRAQQK